MAKTFHGKVQTNFAFLMSAYSTCKINWINNFPSSIQGRVEDTLDALIVLEACRQGVLPRINRRLLAAERGEALSANPTKFDDMYPNDSESSSPTFPLASPHSQQVNTSSRLNYTNDVKEEIPNPSLITPGSVFVFDEKESGICRWTDGRIWSPSRICGNFLVYRELFRKLTNEKCWNSNDKAKMKNGSGLKDKALKDKVAKDNLVVLGCMKGTFVLKKDGLIKKTICVRGLEVLSPEELRKLNNQGNRGRVGKRGKGSQPPIFKMGDTQHLVCYERAGAMYDLHRPKEYLELLELPLSKTFITKQKYRNPICILPLAPGEEPIDPYDEYIRNTRVAESRSSGKDTDGDINEQSTTASGALSIDNQKPASKRVSRRNLKTKPSYTKTNLSDKDETIKAEFARTISNNNNSDTEIVSQGHGSTSGSEYKEHMGQPTYSTELIQRFSHPYSTRGRSKILEYQDQSLNFSKYDRNNLQSYIMDNRSGGFKIQESSHAGQNTESISQKNLESSDHIFEDPSSTATGRSISISRIESDSIQSVCSTRNHFLSVHGIKRNGEWRLCTGSDTTPVGFPGYYSSLRYDTVRRTQDSTDEWHNNSDSRDSDPRLNSQVFQAASRESADANRSNTETIDRSELNDINCSGHDSSISESSPRSNRGPESVVIVKCEAPSPKSVHSLNPAHYSTVSSPALGYWSGSSLSSGRSLSSSLSLSPQNTAEKLLDEVLTGDQSSESAKLMSIQEQQNQLELQMPHIYQDIKQEGRVREASEMTFSHFPQPIIPNGTIDASIATVPSPPFQTSSFHARSPGDQYDSQVHGGAVLSSYTFSNIATESIHPDVILPFPVTHTANSKLHVFTDGFHSTQSESNIPRLSRSLDFQYDQQLLETQQSTSLDRSYRVPNYKELSSDQLECSPSIYFTGETIIETRQSSLAPQHCVTENFEETPMEFLSDPSSLISAKSNPHRHHEMTLTNSEVIGSNFKEHLFNTSDSSIFQESTEQYNPDISFGFGEYTERGLDIYTTSEMNQYDRKTSDEVLIAPNEGLLELKKWNLTEDVICQRERSDRILRSDDILEWPSASSNTGRLTSKRKNAVSDAKVSSPCATPRSIPTCNEVLSLSSNTLGDCKGSAGSSTTNYNCQPHRTLGQRVQYKSPSSYLFPAGNSSISVGDNQPKSLTYLLNAEYTISSYSNCHQEDRTLFPKDIPKPFPASHAPKSNSCANPLFPSIDEPVLEYTITSAASYQPIDNDLTGAIHNSKIWTKGKTGNGFEHTKFVTQIL
ncbi:hypothetical protein BGZ76_007714 [Entomortierella beljakovae]|nr:hypothetical protein BGZ76_007714 [Entomortierella beljakovae]